MRKIGLTNNQLKLIAMLTMTIDHIGYILFPRVVWLRLVGRLAFPIFAYMIAEGCSHTRSLKRYLGSMVAMAAVSQVVSFVVMGSLMQCIMVTFSLSIGLIILAKWAKEKPSVFRWGLFAVGVVTCFGISELLPRVVKGFTIDYNFIGIILPVCIYLVRGKLAKLGVSLVCLGILAADAWWGQWFSLLSIPLLALYNGQRGEWRIKWLFYFYYPAHLALLWLVSFIV